MMITGRTAIKATASIFAMGMMAATPFAAGVANAAPPAKTAVLDCSGTPHVMPKAIAVDCAGGTERTLISVTWSEWNADNAIGQGVLVDGSARTNPAGAKAGRKVGIHVHSPVGSGNGKRFSQMTFGSAQPSGNKFDTVRLP